MSALNETEVLITFNELLKLEDVDISACVDKYSALNICKTSCAPPNEIYNLWAQKLFKTYNLNEFTSQDWQTIIAYLRNVLEQFVKHLNVLNGTSYNEVEQWWLDSLELLKCIKTINTLDVPILYLFLIFALEIIIRTYKFANEKNFKILISIQQLVITLINNYLYKMPLKDDNDLKSFDKIISSLCDVGSIVMWADMKISIETWRTVAKLIEKFYNSFRKNGNSMDLEMHWNEKAILGIFQELNKLLRLYGVNPHPNNENLLRVAEFYLKLLKVIINYSKQTINKFLATKEFIEAYTFCQHEVVNKKNHNVELFLYKHLTDIFSLVHRENIFTEVLLQHLEYGAENLVSCKLVFDYLKVNIKSCSTKSLNVQPDVEMLLKVYNFLVKGPLIFINKDKYTQMLENFVGFTILDCTNQIHKKLCEYIMDSSWIRAYTSMEVLTIYYSSILNQQKRDATFKCLQFWCNMWNKVNKSIESYRQNKKLVEVLLKTILHNISNDNIQKYAINIENIEIILLKSDKQTEQSLQYLHTHLNQNLKKMQERCINGEAYKEMLNLLDICISRPLFINNDFLKESVLTTLTGLLILPASERQKFQEFINKCLRLFSLQENQQQSEKLLKYLMDHEQQCCNIQSVFLIEFLLKQRPQSTKLLNEFKTINKLTSTIVNLIDCMPLNNHPIDLEIFKTLPQTFLKSCNQYNELEQINKKPRLDESNFSNIKFILHDINTNTQKLLNIPHSSFDDKDLELIRTIKNSIDKLLTN